MTQIENAQIKELSNQIEAQNIRIESQIIRQEQSNLVVHEIKDALLGNPIGKDGGLVKRLELLETSVEAFRVIKSKWLGVIWFVVAGSGGLALVYYATSIWNNLHLHK